MSSGVFFFLALSPSLWLHSLLMGWQEIELWFPFYQLNKPHGKRLPFSFGFMQHPDSQPGWGHMSFPEPVTVPVTHAPLESGGWAFPQRNISKLLPEEVGMNAGQTEQQVSTMLLRPAPPSPPPTILTESPSLIGRGQVCYKVHKRNQNIPENKMRRRKPNIPELLRKVQKW